MRKQIIITALFLLPFFALAQTDSIPVFKGKQQIGFLYGKAGSTCTDCIIIDTIKIASQTLLVQTPVTIVRRGNEESDPVFDRLVLVVVKEEKGKSKLTFNNIATATSESVYFKRNKKDLIVVKKVTSSNGSAKVALGKGDYTDYPATIICYDNGTNKRLTGNTIKYTELFGKKESLSCFDCPTQFTVEKCLEMKKQKQKFKWE